MSRRLAWVYIRTQPQPKISLPATDFSGFCRLVAGSFRDLAKILFSEIRIGKCLREIRSPYFVWTSGLDIYTHPTAAQNFSTCDQIFSRPSGSAPWCSTFLRPRTWPEKLGKIFSQAQGDIKIWKSVFCPDIWPEYIYAPDFPAFQAPSAGVRISTQVTSAAFLPRQKFQQSTPFCASYDPARQGQLPRRSLPGLSLPALLQL